MLAASFNDPALQAIAEIVHDIDLKDEKFSREQTAGIAHLISGICISPRRSMTVPATEEVVKTLGLRKGIRVVAADLSGL